MVLAPTKTACSCSLVVSLTRVSGDEVDVQCVAGNVGVSFDGFDGWGYAGVHVFQPGYVALLCFQGHGHLLLCIACFQSYFDQFTA